MFCEMIGEAYVEAFGLSYASGECHSPMFSILKTTFLGWNRCCVLINILLAVIDDVSMHAQVDYYMLYAL